MILIKRIPNRQQIFHLFAVIIFTIHVWVILNFAYIVPALRLRLTLGELLGVLSYVLAFALLESMVFLTALLLLAFVLPRRWLLEKIVVRGAVIVVISVLWMVPVHYSAEIISVFFNTAFLRQSFWFLVIGTFLFTVWDLIQVADRHPALYRAILTSIERLGAVSWFYFLADLMGVFVVVYRMWS